MSDQEFPRPLELAPLWFGAEQSLLSTDVDAFVDAISLSAPLADFDAVVHRRQFRHRSSTVVVGDVAVTHCAHTPIRGSTEDAPEALINLIFEGGIDYILEGRPWQATVDQGVYLPGQAMTGRGSGCSVLFNLNPARLSRELCFLSQERLPLEKAMAMVQAPALIDRRDPRICAVLEGLRLALGLVDVCRGPHGTVQQDIGQGLEATIYRASALLLVPDLLSVQALP